MAALSPQQQTAVKWVQDNEARLSDFHQLIWNYAEPAFREYKSARAYIELLKNEGFEVEEGSGGMPTAFVATFGEGKPVLGASAEYDATPGNSQKAVPYQAPRDDLHRWAAGHTDPHSALGVGALGGVLGAKAAIEEHNLRGTLKLFGEPAEKVCGSKPIHALLGYYDGIDAFVLYHPSYSGFGNTLRGETVSGSYWSAVFTFECLEPETWINRELSVVKGHVHAAARAPGATDAVCLMYTTTKYTKEAMFPNTSLWTLNEFIMTGGQSTADNSPPRIGQIQYSWRSPDLAIQEQIYRILEHNARHVAEITHCRLSIRWVSKVRPGVPNLALTDLVYRNLELVGPPRYGDEAREIARKMQENCGLVPMADPLDEVCEQIVPVEETEATFRANVPPWQARFSSDDAMEYSWYAPMTKLMTSYAVLKPPTPGYVYPAWTRNAIGGIRATIDPSIFVAAKVVGASLVELLIDSDKLRECQEEFEERTGGGVGGRKWIGPLLPPGTAPPVDLRWPEYITTVRGEEWWIPTSIVGMAD